MNFPDFGHARLGDFSLADGVAHLNHGSYGAAPRVVTDAAQAWRERMEADPTSFYRDVLPGATRAAAERVARFLGGRGDDWAFLENATQGTSAVIASLKLEPGDELLCLSQVYNAVGNTLRHYAERAGARVVTVPVPVPFIDPEPLLGALAAALGPRTRLACFDHISSAGAVVFPIREMAALCRARAVPVAVDGAHAPGQIALDVPALGVDYYVANLHKWAFAARGTAVIWCAPERQAALHPVAISHNLGHGFAAEFDFSGTRDSSPWLAVPEALDYLAGLGAEAVRAHNDALARDAAEMWRDAWNSEVAAAPQFRAAMASVRLPGVGAADRSAARRVARHLREAHGVSAGVMVIDGAVWLRVSAQIYNELRDYQPLAAIGRGLMREFGV
ncbi:MAG TPA: aminotransferase class V-fold PLP-dependent enzyme [Stellaceae bacterium]|nr:aminotransferase class V-fold PLP-dependent enzyme [Stellaceae bacterium]